MASPLYRKEEEDEEEDLCYYLQKYKHIWNFIDPSEIIIPISKKLFHKCRIILYMLLIQNCYIYLQRLCHKPYGMLVCAHVHTHSSFTQNSTEFLTDTPILKNNITRPVVLVTSPNYRTCSYFQLNMFINR